MTPTAKRAKQRARARAEKAVRWIIAHHAATYAKAATVHDVSVHAIRARINHRYGSLAAARTQAQPAPVIAKWARPCITCGATETRPKGQYRCNRCREKAGQFHDGGV